MTTDYLALDAGRIVETVERLAARVNERFPSFGLALVAQELLVVARRAEDQAAQIHRPIWWVRVIYLLLVIALLGLGVLSISALRSAQLSVDGASVLDYLQATESVINEVILLGAAIFFLARWEGRIVRQQMLAALHELRSLAHVVDMHQLTKDPDRFRPGVLLTPSSPVREMSQFELSRYLDYCSEMLSLIGKIAALYAQDSDDPAVLAAVNEIESLTTGLSRKIWQKLMIVYSSPLFTAQ
ncbi:MAG: hypothetical protein KJZ86_19005 [Caldilineaceae bacterium]|nr:hypothetical protein [Caldilineaceae bacterium]HRJ44239.1 hypothetical protein [Caldilineaceae bacterium]